MPRCHIDHIVVTSPSLERGADYLYQTLGVMPQPGGEHPRMGTHNLLLRLGDALYLEVIATNPRAPAPGRSRWFGLDSMKAVSQPALSTWVARSEDIRASTAGCPEPLGEVEAMSRGPYEWLITVPADGRVPLDGVAPALIEWRSAVHPASQLDECGCSLVELTVRHPDPVRVARLLNTLGLSEVAVEPLPAGSTTPHLVAVIDTPQGRKILSPVCPPVR